MNNFSIFKQNYASIFDMLIVNHISWVSLECRRVGTLGDGQMVVEVYASPLLRGGHSLPPVPMYVYLMLDLITARLLHFQK